MARQRMRNKTDCVDRFLLKDHTDYGYTGSRSIYFEGDVLYSYGEHWPLCIEHHKLENIDDQGRPTWGKMYFVNANNYSSSTAQQKWCLIRRLDALKKEYVLIQNPKDNKLMINLHKWIKFKRLMLKLDYQLVDLDDDNAPMQFDLIQNSLEQHLLEQLVKSIRAKKNKINEKQLIANTNRMIKHIKHIDRDWKDKRLTKDGNCALFVDKANPKYFAALPKTHMTELMKDFLKSMQSWATNNSVHLINLKFYQHIVEKYELNRKDIEQELLVDKLANA